MWIWYSQLCCFWIYFGHVNLIFTALLLFLILFWSCESDIHSFAVVFDFILVMWIWYSQLCCCFWFYSGHVNLIFTVLLLFLILFWSCESDIHSFAVVFDFILVMWIWYSQFCCCFWFYSGHVNLIFTALLLFFNLFWSGESDIHSFAVVFDFILVMWIWYSQFCCCFDFILVMWIWYSQLCCCFRFYFGHVNLIFTVLLLFWFHFGHVNLIFTALLLFLILFWSCESDIHSFAVVLISFWSCESHIHSFAVVFDFILVMWILYS